MKRDALGGTLRKSDIERRVALMGWVHRRRDHGGVIFIDLRDRSGLVQVVFDPANDKESHEAAGRLRAEFCIAVTGAVFARPPETENPNLPTGEIEVFVDAIEILSASKPLPVQVADDEEADAVNETTRLTYRYLDMRRPSVRSRFVVRNNVMQAVRRFAAENEFLEIETPFLIKPTPEGARDFLVPSRMHPGKFYSLPQSPQLFKQILMVAGFERYFQVVRCMRDEDQRADRQLEFTQVDYEMSFADVDDVIGFTEGVIAAAFREGLGVEVTPPFPRITYREAMDRYGCDKPDIRFGMELRDVSDIVGSSGFKVFADMVRGGGVVKGLCCKGTENFSRKDYDDLIKFAQELGAQGLAYIVVRPDELKSPIAKFLTEDELRGIVERMEAEPGDSVFFVADNPAAANDALYRLRLHLGRKQGLIPEDTFQFVWVVDFPLVEWDEEENRWMSTHHPFTMPADADVDKLESDPGAIKSKAYDIVLNGTELGGGSIRIHKPELQERVLRMLGISDEDAQEKFGFLIESFKYGPPPHGGLAIGLDRMIALMLGLDSIRDAIPFPKTQSGVCPLTDAPFSIPEKSLRELHIRSVAVKKEDGQPLSG